MTTALLLPSSAQARPHDLTTWARYEHFRLTRHIERHDLHRLDLLKVLPDVHQDIWREWTEFDAHWSEVEASYRIPETGYSEGPTDWWAIAQCESGGDPTKNTGNGYFGLLQFDMQTWTGAGCTKYAPRADLASADEQIACASGLSLSRWPICGANA